MADHAPADTAELDELRHRYSQALDEVYALRVVLAHVAKVTDETLALKTFPKSRRRETESACEVMKRSARGDADGVYRTIAKPKTVLRLAGASETMTRREWEAQRDEQRDSRASGGQST